ncbi:hypothetical protein LWC35_26335 [Pseudonocardia kujensis]|uniref:hypothetical protein n=1 Tax=Pseudonocardia kujensis TaxID=1128675 RepID=UPI001E5AD8FD|nr:hypothetical protein [Pseudonocardia kujensis]MCE0766395.1 hypothetical protein [Pseudonocardia kujensis]
MPHRSGSAAGPARTPLALALAAIAVLVIGAGVVSCARGNSEDAGEAHGLPKYYAAADLLTAVTQRQHADRTAHLSLSGRVDAVEGAPTALGGDGALRVEQGGGLSVQFVQTLSPPGGEPQSTAFLVLPNGQVWRQGDTGWTRIDEAATGTPEKILATTAANVVASADPTANLARYRDAALVADAADDAVGGVPAVRYLVVVDLVRAAELEQDPAVQEALRTQAGAGVTRISSTLWVDAANRPLRSETRQTMPGIGTLALTSDYRDWGTPVAIASPGTAA